VSFALLREAESLLRSAGVDVAVRSYGGVRDQSLVETLTSLLVALVPFLQPGRDRVEVDILSDAVEIALRSSLGVKRDLEFRITLRPGRAEVLIEFPTSREDLPARLTLRELYRRYPLGRSSALLPNPLLLEAPWPALPEVERVVSAIVQVPHEVLSDVLALSDYARLVAERVRDLLSLISALPITVTRLETPLLGFSLTVPLVGGVTPFSAVARGEDAVAFESLMRKAVLVLDRELPVVLLVEPHFRTYEDVLEHVIVYRTPVGELYRKLEGEAVAVEIGCRIPREGDYEKLTRKVRSRLGEAVMHGYLTREEARRVVESIQRGLELARQL